MRICGNLPIFSLGGPLGTTILYAPGALALVTPDQARAIALSLSGEGPVDPAIAEPRSWLLEKAEEAAKAWERWLSEEFKPECLTAYLSASCPLACASASPGRRGRWARKASSTRRFS